MWSPGSLALVSILLIHNAHAAALLPLGLGDSIATTVSTAIASATAGGNAIIESVADGVKSDIPLGAFGEFRTHTLEEILADPSLLHTDTTTQTSGTDSIQQDFDEASNFIGASTGEFKIANTDADVANTDAEAAAAAAAAAAASCPSAAHRYEWRRYADDDKQAFLSAVVCLTNLPSGGPHFAPSGNRYEDFVVTHQKLTPEIHGNGIFIFWHRSFVHTFEEVLRTQCGFDRAMPWWDETMDSGAFQESPVFTPAWFGTLPGPTNEAGTCITDGQFANLICNVGPGDTNVRHCLSRAGDETMTSQSSTSYVNYCARSSTFGAFSSCAETGPHAWAHNGIGSVMADVYASPCDPIFFMHHLFVDHQLASWQEVDAARTQTVTGACRDDTSPCTNPVTLATELNMNWLRANTTVGDVINTRAGLLCYQYDYYS